MRALRPPRCRAAATRRLYSTCLAEPRQATAPAVLFRVLRADVTVGNGRVLARDFELEVTEGSRWAIVGPNGCGKSTVSRLVGSSFCGVEEGDECEPFASIAFESHRVLLQDELREYRESRSDVTRLRATLASYLFPHLSPEDPNFRGGFRATASDGTRVGFRPSATRLGPLPVAYDSGADEPLLAELEAAVTSGEAGRLLSAFGLDDVRHRPIYAMSTG